MHKAEILAKYDSMYKIEKSKKFLKHLIYAFMPWKGTVIWTTEIPKGARCSVTNDKILSLPEMAEVMSELTLKTICADIKEPGSGKVIAEKELEGISVGVCSNESERFLSKLAYDTLREWVIGRVMRGDREILRMTEHMRLDEMGVSQEPTVREPKYIHEADVPLMDIPEEPVQFNNKPLPKPKGLGDLISEAIKGECDDEKEK